ncbi:myrosinase 1 isoform X1 [Camponotus floridanus]|uniref:myrosinase 1 isoform X1 n=1 Tax=Camponotus floridanus TaxID=104421 RepID=UPI000DC6B8C7|nr:myrosinase 1 isoform X1 [Camponotus floridanus]
MAHYLFLVVAVNFIFSITYVFANNTLSFPKDFLLGASTAAYQIEGGWNESGKSENIWDRWLHENPSVVPDGSNGDVACDSLHKYKEDVKILHDLGVDFYRFSVSWTRILPNGYANVINQEGLNYYKNLINELLAKGIEPFVTLYHWDHPEILEQMGGWTNEMIVEWISDYARVIFKELGPKVKYFATINEPLVLCSEGYGGNTIAPGKNLGSPATFLCMHNILKAHAKIYHIYDEEFRKDQNGKIGLVIPCSGSLPKNLNDTSAVDMQFQFNCAWTAHAIFSKTGDYPEIMKNHVAENSKLAGFPRSLLPTFSPEWVQYIKGASDFFGLNHYTSRLVETVPRVEGQEWYAYSGVKKSIDPSWPKSASNWLRVVPDGFRQILNKIRKEYDNPPLYVMENGVSDKCCNIFDNSRISYLHSYMQAMLLAIYEDGCNVKGYAVWSILDNFEWLSGYTERLGLVSVNFTDSNRKRTPKWSFYWYKDIIASRKLNSTTNSTELPTVIAVL